MPENDEIGKAIRERKTNETKPRQQSVVQNGHSTKSLKDLREDKPFVLTLKDDGGPYKLLSEI